MDMYSPPPPRKVALVEESPEKENLTVDALDAKLAQVFADDRIRSRVSSTG